ncbi:MAG: 2-oxoglutarate ferredoxin oxidoreductase subunit beta, partial [Kiritimatiellia bacterium]
RKDFMSDQHIRWCPGCGDYSILAQVQTAFTKLGIPKEQFAIISGIGCSSRFPYYMDTFGFHTIHGRAPAVASGLKLARPDLSVWVVTGDGDMLSIGGNHIAHLLRRNVDLNVLLFNNQIYGLTKGQFSPTSELGKKTKSSPMGSVDNPFTPAEFALGCGATMISRAIDTNTKHLRQSIIDAEKHTGTSFVEIRQNCNIFNDGSHSDWTAKDVRDDRVLYMEHGQPLVWGKEQRRGLVQSGMNLKVVVLGDDVTEADCVVHDKTDKGLAWALARLQGFDAPLMLGTLYQVEQEAYGKRVHDQIAAAKKLGAAEISSLLNTKDSWMMT